jgi:hypothetical protein
MHKILNEILAVLRLDVRRSDPSPSQGYGRALGPANQKRCRMGRR